MRETNGETMNDLTTIWHEVSGWPPEQRLELAARLLRSLQQEEGTVPNGTVQPL
jgi:hypothetical protein